MVSRAEARDARIEAFDDASKAHLEQKNLVATLRKRLKRRGIDAHEHLPKWGTPPIHETNPRIVQYLAEYRAQIEARDRLFKAIQSLTPQDRTQLLLSYARTYPKPR